MPNSAFTLTNVSVLYGSVKALDVVSLHIEKGERVGLVGPSGSGKTTLLHLLNATAIPQQGEISVFNQNLAHLSAKEMRALRAHIGFIPQHLGLVPSLRTLHNVILGQCGQRHVLHTLRDILFTSKKDTTAIYQLLERVGIKEKIYHRTDTLSGGQQQRVAIARALFQRPLAILADEPIASVDPARAQSVMRLLDELAQEESLTLCASLHNLELARTFFPRLIGLRQGKIVFDRETSSLNDAEFHQLYTLTAEEKNTAC